MTLVNTEETDWYLLASELGTEVICSSIEVDILNSAIKQPIAKDWLPTIFTGHEEPLPVISVDNKRGFDSSNQCVDGWIALVREALFSIPLVEDIFVSIEDNNVDVWVVIPERDLAILHQIVEREGELFETLVSGENPPFLVDFHIIYRCGRKTEELAPTKAIRLPR